MEYGDTDPTTHAFYGPWIVSGGYHYRECKSGCDVSDTKEKCTYSATCSSGGHCTVCGVAGKELNPTNHKISSEWTTANGYHYHLCEYGCNTEFDRAPCDSEGTCSNPLPCNVCGVDHVKPENHNPEDEWVVVDGTHYHVCLNGCGVKVDYGVCDITPTCVSVGECSACHTAGEAIDPNNHSPETEWTNENGTHYHMCQNGCGVKVEYGVCDITPTCVSAGECSVCHYVGDAIDADAHKFGTEYESDDNIHYILCQNGCGKTKNEGEHNYEWQNTSLSTTTVRGQIKYSCSCGRTLETLESPAVIMPVKGGAESIFVLIHDDGTWNTVLLADELYYKYGLVGDAAVQLNNIFVSTGNRYDLTDDTIDIRSVEKWNQLFETGRWKAMSHSMTHQWWGTYDTDSDGKYVNLVSDADLEYYEIVKSQMLLRQYFPSQRVLTFAYPGFATPKNNIAGVTTAVQKFDAVYNESARALLQQYYIAARSTVNALVDISDPEGTWESESATSGYADFSYTDIWNYIPSYCVDDNLDYFLNAANQAAANKKMAVFFIHKLTDDESKKDESNTLYVGNYDTFLETIAGHVDSGKAWNAFFEDAILYLQEAESAKVSVRLGDDVIYATLTDEISKFMLDENGNETTEQIYNYPLTVRVDVPTDWAAIKYVQGNNIGYAEAKVVDGRWVADAELIPDAGEATITEAALADIPAEETPKPVLGSAKLEYDISYDFEDGIDTIGVTNNDPSNVTTGTSEVEGDTYLNIGKAYGSDNSTSTWTVWGGSSSTQATFMSVSFDIIIDSARLEATDKYANPLSNTRLLNITFGDSTPFALVLNANSSEATKSEDGTYATFDKLYLSAANSNYSTVNALCGLQLGTKYNIRIDVTMDGTNELSAELYIDGEYVTSSSLTANYTVGTVPTVEYIKFATQARAVFDILLDDITIKTTAPTE